MQLIFFKIKINNKKIKYLMICKHVISNDDINNKMIINLYYYEKDKEEKREIILDKDKRYIRIFNEDVTLIDDNISENKYFITNLNYESEYNI